MKKKIAAKHKPTPKPAPKPKAPDKSVIHPGGHDVKVSPEEAERYEKARLTT